MSGKTVEKPEPETEVTVEQSAPHPLDSWLKRELKALSADSEQEPLPPGIAELAGRLEEKLRQAGGGPGDGGTKQAPPSGKRPGPAARGKGTGRDSKR